MICTPDTNIKVELDSYTIRCKYHKKYRKNKYDFYNIAPKGLCPDLFYTIYPHCLALLYDAKVDTVLYCPNPEADIKIKIKVKPMVLKQLLNKTEKLARKYWRPLSLTDKRIIIEVINGNNCPRNHKPNQKFEFNIGFFSELCPAGFHSIYPFVFLMARKKLKTAYVGCPDAKNKIVYKLITK